MWLLHCVSRQHFFILARGINLQPRRQWIQTSCKAGALYTALTQCRDPRPLRQWWRLEKRRRSGSRSQWVRRISAGDLTAETHLRVPASSRIHPRGPCPDGKKFPEKRTVDTLFLSMVTSLRHFKKGNGWTWEKKYLRQSCESLPPKQINKGNTSITYTKAKPYWLAVSPFHIITA